MAGFAQTPQPSRPARYQRPGTSWAWWDQVVLRSTGFPSRGVECLSAPELAARADEVTFAPGSAEWSQFEREFDRGARQVARQLQAIAASPAFQRALTWQNHHVLQTGIAPLLRWDPESGTRNSKHRQHEEVVAAYWQRYCIKNDSIAFFGPVGWGRLEPGSRHTTMRHGPALVRSADVFFEVWAIDCLAETIAGDPAMGPWLKPWRLPHVRVDGDRVLAPGPRARELPPADAEILRACDGVNRCADLPLKAAQALALRGIDQAVTAADVERALSQFEKARWIRRGLDLPIGPRPERDLRSFLAGVDDERAASAALAKLDALEAAMSKVRDAGDDQGALESALDGLDRTFTAITGAGATRRAGHAYAGRTLAYMDCRRDIDFEIGADFFQAAAPLDLIAEAGRWLSYQMCADLRPRLDAIYERLATARQEPVRLSDYWFEALSTVHRGARQALDAIEADYLGRWAAILAVPYDAQRVTYAADRLAPKLREAFEVPAPGWNAARYCSPDVLLAAADLEHVRTGQFQLVLGEIHLAINTQRHYCFVTQHPDPSRLFASVDRDTPQPRLLPVLPKGSPPRLSIRTHPALIRETDYFVASSHQTVAASRPRLFQAADVLLAKRDGALVVVLPDGERFDILDVFSEMLVDAVLNRFRIVPKRSHIPRISFDRLVVVRETWRFDIGALSFAALPDEARRFVQARAWRRGAGVPERVFVSFEDGEKPLFVDFSSPVSISVFARAIRQRTAPGEEGKAVSVSEMLPTLDQLWLSDVAGNRYAAEFRLAAFDLLDDRS